jgi:phosphate starvation-inducible protein PhoH
MDKVNPLSILSNDRKRQVLYGKLDEHQKHYYNSMMDKTVICVNAPAGTGKTTLAVMAGLEMLRIHRVKHLFYIRFPDCRSLKLGYLPGEQQDKELIYMYPFLEACESLGVSREQVALLESKGIIEMTTDVSMRGRNMESCFVILDESQNANISDLQLVLTRLHDNSKCVLIGHSGQVDGRVENIQGLTPFEVYIKHITKKSWGMQCALPKNYRGKVSSWADRIQETIQEIKGGMLND